MDGSPSDASAWDTPIEVMLARYLDTIAPDSAGGGAGREATAAHLRAALRAEPIARGCPSLAMITP
ncbi:MAG: hypothetical protein O2822_06385, partial [Chloroflexi bacterium]|nr:hypothetical protein [Chloroflexota bacterium]